MRIAERAMEIINEARVAVKPDPNSPNEHWRFANPMMWFGKFGTIPIAQEVDQVYRKLYDYYTKEWENARRKSDKAPCLLGAEIVKKYNKKIWKEADVTTALVIDVSTGYRRFEIYFNLDYETKDLVNIVVKGSMYKELKTVKDINSLMAWIYSVQKANDSGTRDISGWGEYSRLHPYGD